MDAYLGVGISAGRWAGVLLGDRRDAAIVADDIAALVTAASAVERPRAIAINIPIGPPVKGLRACDAAARAVLRDHGSLSSTPTWLRWKWRAGTGSRPRGSPRRRR